MSACGTVAAYHGARQCRCDACREAARRNQVRRRLLVGRGVELTMAARPVQERIDELLAHGWTRTGIVRAAQVAPSCVWRIPERRTVHAGTGRKIMALPVGPPPNPRHVDACGARLRLRALAALGWSREAIDEHVHYGAAGIGRIMHGDRPVISADLHARIVAAYDLLWNVTPTRRSAPAARNRAARAGWLLPAELDDDLIDDPDYRPVRLEPVQPWQAGGGLAVDDIEHFVSMGFGLDDLAARFGRKDRYCIAKVCRTAGREDIIKRARRNELARGGAA